MFGSLQGTAAAAQRDRRAEDLQVLEWELGRWLESERRQLMLTGRAYFAGEQEVLRQGRQAIGRGGEPEAVHNLPDNRLVNNQYAKLVIQKTNYMLGQPISWEAEEPRFAKALRLIFDRGFMRLLKRLGKDCYNQGIAWVYPYLDREGRLQFAGFEGREILPFWADTDHSRLEGALRFGANGLWQQGRLIPQYWAELYDLGGVQRFRWQPESGRLIPEGGRQPYLRLGGAGYNWERVPLVPFRLNEREQPLICRVKGLQDALNKLLSHFGNVLEEDAHNTILVIKNYDGTDLGEFRHNLATYGAVKVKTLDGAAGGIDTLSVKVDAGNYQAILELLQQAIIENGLGFDTRLDKSGGWRGANELSIKSMYSDICLDANDLETEWQAAFGELLWFVRCFLANCGCGDFFDTGWRLIFNRDMMIDESEAIDNCVKSLGLLSRRSIVAQHPWVEDVEGELERLENAERI